MESKDTVTEEYKFKNRKEWLSAIQKAPNDGMIKNRVIGSSSIKFIPIAIQDAMCDLLFIEFDIIDIKTEIYNNQILITIKISMLPNYPNSEHRVICGIASKPLGSSKNSLESKGPGTLASAKSNALMSLGNLFGRNLNRGFNNGFSLIKDKE